MERSENPDAFPTKDALVRAGRKDLAEAIARNGRWLSLGWDAKDHQLQTPIPLRGRGSGSRPSTGQRINVPSSSRGFRLRSISLLWAVACTSIPLVY